MCRLPFLVVVATLTLLSACELPAPKPTSNGQVIESSRDLAIGYGSLGPAKVGMTKAEALDTGLFDRQKFDPADKCKASALKWKKQFRGVEVRTDTAGTVRALSVVAPGPKTQYGIEVKESSLADVRAAHASALMGPEQVSRKTTAAFVQKEDRWIGFLFDDHPEDEVLDPVTFIEVTKGSKPELQLTC